METIMKETNVNVNERERKRERGGGGGGRERGKEGGRERGREGGREEGRERERTYSTALPRDPKTAKNGTSCTRRKRPFSINICPIKPMEPHT